MTLTPAYVDLIRALSEAALEQGYLDVEPANEQGSTGDRTKPVRLPPVDRAA